MTASLSALAGLIVAAATAFAAGDAPGELSTLRLETPLSSFSAQPGTPFRATVVQAGESDGGVLLPPGTEVEGLVANVHRVGRGVRRERASLDLAFTFYRLPDGRRFPLSGELVDVENAREEVGRNGVIQGILSAGSPHGMIRGFWHRPQTVLLSRAATGLSGASGMVSKYLLSGPFGMAATIGVSWVVFRWPDPEIVLPAGADLRIRILAVGQGAPRFEPPPAEALPAELDEWLSNTPASITRTDGRAVGDVINVALVGSAQDVKAAFEKAGWVEADPLTPATRRRSYRAFTMRQPYPSAPVSPLHWSGRGPGFVFQKSLNTVAKRHHIRLWSVPYTFDGQPVWLGAATHDVGIVLDPVRFSFTHRINPETDLEREKVAADLAATGCVGSEGWLQRPAVAQDAGEDGKIHTDGALRVLNVLACRGGAPQEMARTHRTYRWPTRLVQRITLESRQYLLRGNVYYLAYRGVKRCFTKTPNQ